MTDFVGISEAASILDVSVDTLRRWEKKGLVRSRRDSSNCREFSLTGIQALKRKRAGDGESRSFQVLTSTPSSYTAIDLFAGAGGTALGLENAGFSHVLVNEIDKYAAATLRANRPKWNVLEQDVHDVDFTPWRHQVDLLEGGFPCQAFSYAGKKLGFADTRGTLFHEFARAVSEVRPRIAMGENVRGLVNHDGGRTLATMRATLNDLGYRVQTKVLRSQYLDTAQKRERLILIAAREDLDVPIQFPQERDYTLSLKDVIGDRPGGPGAKYADWKYEIMKQVPEGGYWRDLPDDLQRKYMKASYFHGGGKTGMARRLAWDEPSLTLTCNPAQKQTERCHPDETRPLNVREYARIQAFPDDWQFVGGITQQYKQIGNAVPVNMAYHVGLAIREMLNAAGGGDQANARSFGCDTAAR
ncbi:DNA (cytosine-5-)-methyltransferase [Brevibacterium luteolum]|uniref:DNA (cytosine-5-)-methyltransferase n=1 Tax=Brevibacterium luteolum TaxID=199591 RepID=UPI003B680D8D